MTHVFLSVGDMSGDQHTARLVEELRARVPGITFEGLGGPNLAAAGVDLHEDLVSRAVIGLSAVARQLPFFFGVLRKVAGILDARRPDAVLLVDYPGLNLYVARLAKRRGIPVYYFVAPQLWAWASWRVRRFARVVDEAFVIHSFEADFFTAAGLPATFVGHPTADALRADSTADPDLVIALAAEPMSVALLPGSRPREVTEHFPVFLQAAARLARTRPALRCHTAHVDPVQRERMATMAADADVPLTIHGDSVHAVMAGCHAALVGSGTATLETGLLGTPMVIYYRLRGALERFVRDWLLVTPWFGEVNLAAGRLVCPEVLQEHPDAAALAEELAPLLEDSEARARQLEGLRRVDTRISGAGMVAATAELLAERLATRPARR